MSLWAALVLRRNYKTADGLRDIPHLMFAEADSQAEAVTAITNAKWDDTKMVKSSEYSIITIYDTENIPPELYTCMPKKRRMRKRSELQTFAKWGVNDETN